MMLAGILATILMSVSLSLLESPHPRLLLTAGEECAVAESVEASEHLKAIESMVYEAADAAVLAKPTVYVKNGRRLLSQSRRSLGRLFALSYAYRFCDFRDADVNATGANAADEFVAGGIVTGADVGGGQHIGKGYTCMKEKYLSAAVAELNSVCSFADWNPTHYLDVAEMCLGVAIAYDWLYDVLPQDIRDMASSAIEHLAIDTALDPQYNGFYNGVSNWLQVCNAGLVFGAIAVADKAPEKCARIMENYKVSITRTVDSYDPDGAYPEGPGYWAYGTDFNALLNYQLEMSGIGPYLGEGGFVRTGDYFLHSTGPTGLLFNYSDCGKKPDTCVSEFYLAQLQSRPELLWNCMRQKIIPDRLLPAAVIFGSRIVGNIVANFGTVESGGVVLNAGAVNSCHSVAKGGAVLNGGASYEPFISDSNGGELLLRRPAELTWFGRGETPVYFARTSWDDPDALYFGVKGGRASRSHGHQDQGSFVFDALGERWVIDLGNENYTVVENAGVKLWNMSQDSPRWNLMAYNNLHHSTMSFDSVRQNVDGKAEIVRIVSGSRRKGAVLDLSECYDNVQSVSRSICLVSPRKKSVEGSSGALEIIDCIVTSGKSVEMEWNLMTSFDTECSVEENGDILMRRNGKSLRIEFHSSDGLQLNSRVEKCIPSTSYETLRAVRVGFTTQLPAGRKCRFRVTLNPVR